MWFFKRIRRRLLINKKLREYLVYAIGEIVLVVIGILIALAIDTGTQQRATEEKESEYLMGLREEFRLNRLKLEELIRVNRRSYEVGNRIANHISQYTEPPSEGDFAEMLYQSFAYDIAFNPNNSLLLEIINSGSLQDLSDLELRLLLTNWMATLTDIGQQEEELYHQRERVLDLFSSDAYSIRTVFDLTGVSERELKLPRANDHHSNLALLESAEFENHLLLFLLTSRSTETLHYRPLLAQVDRILQRLEGAADN
ncbi:DUF6090 family protein [Neolewinella xylanilytica]|uniref:DUF6090 family protein n=1 Tax=Neolewinella xylanilytica TaxID=1514080 RepID=UPI000CEAE24F|nr:DUF6090 family protein [Neolewinella xylanilytica]